MSSFTVIASSNSGLVSKNFDERVLDFQVPLYRPLPMPAQLSMCRDLSLLMAPGLAEKYAAAIEGDSSHNALPLPDHLRK